MGSSHQPGHPDRPKAGRGVDAGFERLLKGAMTGRERAAAGSECIDVETLAAWSDGKLPPSERSIVEAHAARCTRCQDMLAMMARTAPVEAVRGPWSLRRWIMMVAPAATATAAVILWFALEPRRQASDTTAQRVAVDTELDKLASHQAKPAPAAPVEAPAPARADSASSDRPPSARDVGASARLPEAKDTDRSLRKNPQAAKPTAESTSTSARLREELSAALEGEQRRKVGAAADRPANYTLTDEKAGTRSESKTPAAAAAPSSAVAETRAVPQPPAAPPPPPAAVAPPEPKPATTAPLTPPPVQERVAQAEQVVDVQKSARQAQAIGGDAGRGGGTLNRAGLNESIALAPLAIAPADASVQWRVVAGRIVQQSADKGATWGTQYTLDENARLTAGSAPSSTTAWFVGGAGLVVTTSDGRTWRRVPFPEAVDLTGVLATDTRVAIVTTADRRTFTTTDGGSSWSARKN